METEESRVSPKKRKLSERSDLSCELDQPQEVESSSKASQKKDSKTTPFSKGRL
jgi:hypothetical protein